MIREMLRHIDDEYPAAILETFSGHPTAHYVRGDARDLIREVDPT